MGGGGGGNWGYLKLGKKFFRTQVQIHTQQPQYAKKFAPPDPPPKKGVPKCGGVWGSKSKKSFGDHFWS